MTLDIAAQDVCAALDPARPELADILAAHAAGRHLDAATALVKHLRARETPRLGYTRAYIDLLRSRATDARKDAARARIEDALAAPLVTDAHSNPVSRAGADTLFLGADEAVWRRIADRVLAMRERWGGGPWGSTRSIGELIARMFVSPECPDDAPIPLLGWLLKQIVTEWAWARTWDETVLGNSGHNWFLHTYLGFYQAGLWFPEFADFAQFQALAPDYFEYELRLLMESDGFTRERSGYHYGTVQHFLDFLHVAEENGVHLSPAFHAHLREVVATRWKVTAPDGGVPCMGDCGHAHKPDLSLQSLRIDAALFHMPEAKYVAESLAPDWAPPCDGLLPAAGRNVLPDYERVPLRAPDAATADTALPASGYYFMRQNWTRRADWLWVEAGPLGTIVQSHDHTHIFNFELYSRGRPILIDNCTVDYGDSPERTWRVGSFSHNVVTIDGEHNLPLENEWRWAGVAVPYVNDWIPEERYAYFSGAHEAYRRLGVESCRRKIFYLRGEYFILIDRFTPRAAADEHEYQQHFHVAPPCRLDPDGRLVTTGQGGNLLVVPVDAARGDAALEPCPFPAEHCDNPDHLAFTSRVTGNVLFVTLLVPFEDAAVPDVSVELIDVHADGRVLSPWEVTGLRIRIDGRTDVYVDQHMQWNLSWRVADCRGSARLFHSRCPGS